MAGPGPDRTFLPKFDPRLRRGASRRRCFSKISVLLSFVDNVKDVISVGLRTSWSV